MYVRQAIELRVLLLLLLLSVRLINTLNYLLTYLQTRR